MNKVKVIDNKDGTYDLDIWLVGYNFSLKTVSLDFAFQGKQDIEKQFSKIEKADRQEVFIK